MDEHISGICLVNDIVAIHLFSLQFVFLHPGFSDFVWFAEEMHSHLSLIDRSCLAVDVALL